MNFVALWMTAVGVATLLALLGSLGIGEGLLSSPGVLPVVAGAGGLYEVARRLRTGGLD